jgi:hypothetical protein
MDFDGVWEGIFARTKKAINAVSAILHQKKTPNFSKKRDLIQISKYPKN